MAFNPYFSIAKRLMRLRSKPITARRQGAVWELYPNDWIDNRLLIGRPFERTQIEFVKTLIRDRGITHFYDCGANIGLYSVQLGVQCDSLVAINAFEPVSLTYNRLCKNLALNALEGKVTAHIFGLGAKEEIMRIAVDRTSSGTATLDKGVQAHSKRNFEHFEDIQLKVFDNLFQAKNQNAFFKMDMEGHELMAASGMSDFLAENKCTLQIEAWNRNADKIIEAMQAYGYVPFHKINEDLYLEKGT